MKTYLVRLILFVLSAMMFIACVPQEGKKQADCEAGKVFDPLTRQCVTATDSNPSGGGSGGSNNQAPQGTLREITITEDSGQVPHVLTFIDVEGDAPSTCTAVEDDPFNIITLVPISGSLCLCSGQRCFVVMYPNSNMNGLAGLTYTITDIYNNTSLEQQVSIDVTAVNDPPDFGIASYSVPTALIEPTGSQPIPTLNFTLPSATDIDSNISSVYYQLSAYPANGSIINCMGQSASLLTDLDCDYTPANADVDTGDSFSYIACDGYLCSNPLSVNITIVPSNDAPQAISSTETISGLEDDTNGSQTSFDYTITSIQDVDSTSLTFTIVMAPTYGSATFNNNVITYTINDGNINDNNVSSLYGRSTIDTLTFYACDSGGPPCSGNVNATISITPQNDAPSIDVTNLPLNWVYASATSSLTYSASESSTYSSTQYLVYLPIMLDAEIDGGEGGSLVYSYTLETGISGTIDEISFTGTPYFKFTPVDGNFSGAIDLFKYSASDGTVSSTEYMVSLNIVEVNDEPILCEYTRYEDANECSESDCLGTQSPIGVITPSKADIYYFDYAQGLCYQSTSSGGWDIIAGSYVSDQIINEGDEIRMYNLRVDEGGGTTTADQQDITITNIQSTDLNLIKPRNILFYYKDESNYIGSGDDASFNLGDGVANSASHDLLIKIVPSQSNYGMAQISFELHDNGVNPQVTGNISFNVTVNPVSAAHKGWINLKALGPKVNNQGEIRDITTMCNYNRAGCNAGDPCTGSGDPDSLSIIADGKYAIYYDSTGDKCYYSDGTSDNYTWSKFTTERYQNPSSPTDNHYLLCNISTVEASPECATLGSDIKSCIGDGTPVNVFVPTRRNTFYYDITNDQCYRSTGDINDQQWQSYDTTGSVELHWESFIVYGNGSIEGFNVYRRVSSDVFNYDTPINKDTIASTDTIYIDSSANSIIPPVPNTVYFYEVRPIIGGIPTGTSGLTKNPRILVPPRNRAFVHRWIVNKTICSEMGLTSDIANNYRCTYFGPGMDATNSYFDIAKDMIVDRFEAGCNYSRPIDCVFASDPNNDKSCIGLVDPNGEVTSQTGKIYYNRRSGICYVSTTGGNNSWEPIYNSANPIVIARIPNGGHTYAELPPISQALQEDAHIYCGRQSITNILGSSTYGTTTFSGSLPNRLQQIAFSWWPDETEDTDVTTLESGYSLNASSKCNSSAAHGVSVNYNDDRIPASPILYSLPATESFQDSDGKDVRSVMTGSDLTAMCSSRYGIQDAVGNMAEWNLDRVLCDVATGCRSVASLDGIDYLQVGNGSLYDTFRLNDESGGTPTFKGPCHDVGGTDSECDGVLGDWTIDQELHSSTRFLIPVGLPVHENFITQYPNDPMNNYIFQIGPVSGVSANELHDDKFIFNTDDLLNVGNAGVFGTFSGGFSSGGSYLSGSGAGVWNLETVPNYVSNNPNRKPSQGFRCVYQIDSTNYEE